MRKQEEREKDSIGALKGKREPLLAVALHTKPMLEGRHLSQISTFKTMMCRWSTTISSIIRRRNDSCLKSY
jgi:hypothetical protein